MRAGAVVERLLRAVAPGTGDDGGRAGLEANLEGRRAGVESASEPRLRRREPDRSVAAAVGERAQRADEVERSAERDAALDHRRMARSIGAGPAWMASNSVRLRMPWYPSLTMSCAHAAPSELPGPGSRTTSGAYSRSATRNARAKSHGASAWPTEACGGRARRHRSTMA